MKTKNNRTTIERINIGLVQINNSFSGQNYLPYSIGCLQAYASADKSLANRITFLTPIYKREPVTEVVEKLASAHIIGFSLYVWNANISLEIAKRLKVKNPEVLVVCGGPQVPDKAENFLREHTFIDVVVHGEGEQTFARLLTGYPERKWSNHTGISYIDSCGTFRVTPPTPRLSDLRVLPSPLLTGAFDNLMQCYSDETWIGLWESNRGCPFRCTFCDWGSATAAKVSKFDMERLYAELDWFAENKIEYVFVCDANFGIQKRDIKLANYVAVLRNKTGYPHGFSVQNTKNATERAYETQKILSDAGLNKGVALSMQSLDSFTLESIKRDNISLETYFELARRFSKDKVETYSDLILGLPGETYESFCHGVGSLVESGQHNRVQFNNLSILPNSEMGDPDYQLRYGMQTVRSEIINIHGQRIDMKDDVPEYQDLVIATSAMPAEDWVRTRSFAWMISFLYFDKFLQLPMLMMNKIGGFSFRLMTEAFLTVDDAKYPTIARVKNSFFAHAKAIQDGGPEYIFSQDWLGIYWPADEFAFICLTEENKINTFYQEANSVLYSLLKLKNSRISTSMLNEAIELNKNLLSQPFREDYLSLRLSYDFISFWESIRFGNEKPLKAGTFNVEIDRSTPHYDNMLDWCREIVWWGNKKGAYLYGGCESTPVKELAGHY